MSDLPGMGWECKSSQIAQYRDKQDSVEYENKTKGQKRTSGIKKFTETK